MFQDDWVWRSNGQKILNVQRIKDFLGKEGKVKWIWETSSLYRLTESNIFLQRVFIYKKESEPLLFGSSLFSQRSQSCQPWFFKPWIHGNWNENLKGKKRKPLYYRILKLRVKTVGEEKKVKVMLSSFIRMTKMPFSFNQRKVFIALNERWMMMMELQFHSILKMAQLFCCFSSIDDHVVPFLFFPSKSFYIIINGNMWGYIVTNACYNYHVIVFFVSKLWEWFKSKALLEVKTFNFLLYYLLILWIGWTSGDLAGLYIKHQNLYIISSSD